MSLTFIHSFRVIATGRERTVQVLNVNAWHGGLTTHGCHPELPGLAPRSLVIGMTWRGEFSREGHPRGVFFGFGRRQLEPQIDRS